MSIVAIITGDIIHSSRLQTAERIQLMERLEQIFEDLEAQSLLDGREIFRGDSFQLMLSNADEALKAALLIKTGLKKNIYEVKEGKQQADARISIGIGEISYQGERLGTSDGEAYRLSGRALDKMKKRNSLTINSIWREVNEEMDVACALSEAIIGRWTQAQSAIIYAYLLNNKTQQVLAKEFNITQGAVSQHLSEAGHMDAIRMFLERFRKVISEKL